MDKIAEYERSYGKEPKDRPIIFAVEPAFDQFVAEFGGQKISDLLSTKALMPQNADYLFRSDNVIAELKTIEGIYSGPTAASSFRQAFIDAGHGPASLLGVIFGREEIPGPVFDLIRRRMRRAFEQRIKKARKQIKQSKQSFGDAETQSLILIAMDERPMFGQGRMLQILGELMSDNYANDPNCDGIVYLNPNVPTQAQRGGMEFSGWFPVYRDDDVNRALSGFVDRLGSGWLEFCAKKTGARNPILKLDSFKEFHKVLSGESGAK